MTDPAVLADYEKWLHKVANSIAGPSEHDDIVQEGRVAMWRALSTHDESKGALAPWLTRAAEMRMKDVAWGTGQPTGHEALRGSRQVEEGPSLDEQPEEIVQALLGYVEAAYHDGEIMKIIRECLTPKQQEYVFLRFWGGLEPRAQAPQIRALVLEFPVLGQRWHWQRAREVLAERLAHLAS